MSADDAQTLEADFEKTNDETRERSVLLVVVLLIVSVAVHIGLMLSVSDVSFTPLVENVHTDRKLTKDLPTMQMRKYEGDPLAEVMRDVPRPAPAPNEERSSDRVERLSGDISGAVAPEMPESPASILPPAQPDVAPRAVDVERGLGPRVLRDRVLDLAHDARALQGVCDHGKIGERDLAGLADHFFPVAIEIKII